MNSFIFVKNTHGRLTVKGDKPKLYLDGKELKGFVDMSEFWHPSLTRVEVAKIIAFTVLKLRIPFTSIHLLEVNKDNGLDVKFVEPIESADIPGFYHALLNPDLLVSKNGEVINAFTFEHVETRTENPPNDYVYVLSGWKKYSSVHRIMMYAFSCLFISEMNVLVSNHLNGVKYDNRLENLEWVTKKRNLDHAYDTGLRTDNIPVIIKDYVTDNELRFRSAAKAAVFISSETSGRDVEQTLLNRLKSDDLRLIEGRFAAKKEGSDLEFISSITEASKGLRKIILVKDVVTDEVIEVLGEHGLAELLESKGINVPRTNLSFYLSQQARFKTIRRPLHKYVFKRNTDEFDFPTLTKTEKLYFSRCYELPNLKDVDSFGICVYKGDEVVDVFASVSQAARYLGLTNTTVFNAFHVARNRGIVSIYTEKYGYITFDRLYKERIFYPLNKIVP